MARVTIERLARHFGAVRAVDGISLRIDDGEFIAILGPSGCGKSTTLFLLSGIELPDSGRILFDDEDVTRLEARTRGIGLVFQSYALYPHMSVLENIGFPLEMLKLPKAERLERARRAAAIVKIEALLDRRPHQLSGGQQQRVALARALVKEPRLLLLDEPLSNLDASLRHAMRSEIRRLQRRLKLTTVLVTHDQIEATTMADRIVVMNEGRIEQVGTPEDLYQRPANLFVARFIGSPAINLVEARVREGRMWLGELALGWLATGLERVTIGIRPEHLRIGGHGHAGRVVLVEPMGREVLYEVETAFGSLRVLDPVHAVRFGEGDAVAVAPDADQVLAFDPADGRALARTGARPVPLRGAALRGAPPEITEKTA